MSWTGVCLLFLVHFYVSILFFFVWFWFLFKCFGLCFGFYVVFHLSFVSVLFVWVFFKVFRNCARSRKGQKKDGRNTLCAFDCCSNVLSWNWLSGNNHDQRRVVFDERSLADAAEKTIAETSGMPTHRQILNSQQLNTFYNFLLWHLLGKCLNVFTIFNQFSTNFLIDLLIVQVFIIQQFLLFEINVVVCCRFLNKFVANCYYYSLAILNIVNVFRNLLNLFCLIN